MKTLGWAHAPSCRGAAQGPASAGGGALVLLSITAPTSRPLISPLRPKDGPHRHHPLGSVHPLELGTMTTGEARPLGE